MFDESFWVACSIILFVGLMFNYIRSYGKKFLEGKISSICTKLDEAENLNIEANKVLEQQRQKHKLAKVEIKEIEKNTEEEIAQLKKDAEKELSYKMEHKSNNAQDRIASNEAKALANLRLETVEIATKISIAILAKQKSAASDQKLLNQALSSLKLSIN